MKPQLLLMLLPALAVLVLLPGVAYARLLGAGPAGLRRWILSIHLGIAGWGLSASAAYFLGNQLWMAVSIQAVLAMLAVVFSRGRDWQLPRPKISVAGVLVLGFALVPLLAAPSNLRIHADDGAHVAQLRAVAASAQVFPNSIFHPEGQVPGPDPRFGAAHALYGLLSIITDQEADQVWLALRWILAPLLWLSFWLLARALVPPRSALLATLLAVLILGGVRFRPDWLSAYPLWLGMGAMWVCLAAWLDRLRGRNPGMADLFILGSLVLVHFFPWLAGAIGLGLLLVVSARSNPGLHRPAAITLGVALFALMIRLLPGFGTENPLHRESWGLLDLGSGWVIFHPLTVLGALGLAGLIVGPLVLLWRAPIGGNASVDRVHRSWLFVPWLLVLNPVAVRLLEPGIGFLNYRLLLLATTPIFLAAWLLRGSIRMRLMATLLLLLTLPMIFERWDSPTPQIWDEATRGHYRSLAEQLPDDACIASDPYTMLGLNAFAGVKVLALPDGRSSPRDARAVDRLRTAASIYDPAIPRAALEVFGVTHILYAPTWEADLRGYRVMLARDQIRPSSEAFAAPPMELAGLPSGWVLQSLNAAMPSNESALAAAASSNDGDRFVDIQALPETIAPGAALEISLSYDLAASDGSSVPRLYMRLDHENLSGGDGAFGKLIRKFKEKRSGLRERTRMHFELEDSPQASRVEVHGTFRIPRDLKPGPYTLQAQLLREERSPTESLRDLFQNRDRYSGLPVAHLELIP